MIHQILSFQVILDSGNRIVKMPARQLPYVLSLGVRKPIFYDNEVRIRYLQFFERPYFLYAAEDT